MLLRCPLAVVPGRKSPSRQRVGRYTQGKTIRPAPGDVKVFEGKKRRNSCFFEVFCRFTRLLFEIWQNGFEKAAFRLKKPCLARDGCFPLLLRARMGEKHERPSQAAAKLCIWADYSAGFCSLKAACRCNIFDLRVITFAACGVHHRATLVASAHRRQENALNGLTSQTQKRPCSRKIRSKAADHGYILRRGRFFAAFGGFCFILWR